MKKITYRLSYIALLLFPLYTYAFDMKFITTAEMLQRAGDPETHGLYQAQQINGVIKNEIIYVDKDYWNAMYVAYHEVGHVLYNRIDQKERDYWKLSFYSGNIICPTVYCETSEREAFAEIAATLVNTKVCNTSSCLWVKQQMAEHELDWPVQKETVVKQAPVVPKKAVTKKTRVNRTSHFPNPRRSR